MPNHFTSLGFNVRETEDFQRLAQLTSEKGEALAAPAGYYLLYKVDSYVELWGQASPTAELIDCVPHYAGESRIKMGVGDLLRRREQPLDGSVYGWANPTGDRADSGDYPIVVKVPDFDIFRARVAPRTVITLQITAFANEIDVFPDDDAFVASQSNRMKLAPESFIPSGLFADNSDAEAAPTANAIFSGHIRQADVRVNGLTGGEYYHLLVSTYGGVYDVVADPELFTEKPTDGRVVRGSFWLTGRLSA